MDFSPRKRARSTFDQDQAWRETDAAFLDPTTMAIPKVPRAWERKPKTTVRDGKEKKVWRKYGLRSQNEDVNNESEGEADGPNSPARVVKKLRVRPNDSLDASNGRKAKTRSARATQWDRRKSGLPSINTLSTSFSNYLTPSNRENAF